MSEVTQQRSGEAKLTLGSLSLLGVVADLSYHPVAALPRSSPLGPMCLPLLNLDAVDCIMPYSLHEGEVGGSPSPFCAIKWSRMEGPPEAFPALLRPWVFVQL